MESKESRSIPKDAQVIHSILKDMGIQEYENRVVNQLLDFAYRYVTTVLDDAQVFSQYARKRAIDSEDVKLAIQLQVEKMYSNPPPRDLLLDIARNKNSQPLPPIKSQSGTRLPPDRYSLTNSNFRLKSSAEIRSSSNNTFQSTPVARNNSLLSSLTRQTIQLQTQKSRPSTTTTTSQQTLVTNPGMSASNGSSNQASDNKTGLKRKLDDSDNQFN